MKKTYNINLNGQVFCIDDDACLKLQSYIDTLESHYLKEEVKFWLYLVVCEYPYK